MMNGASPMLCWIRWSLFSCMRGISSVSFAIHRRVHAYVVHGTELSSDTQHWFTQHHNSLLASGAMQTWISTVPETRDSRLSNLSLTPTTSHCSSTLPSVPVVGCYGENEKPININPRWCVSETQSYEDQQADPRQHPRGPPDVPSAHQERRPPS